METEIKTARHRPSNTPLLIAWILSGFLIVLGWSLLFEFTAMVAMLAAGLAVVVAVVYFDQVWMAMILLLPFSVEIGGERGAEGLGLTLPTEGLIAILFLAFVIRTLFRLKVQYMVSPMNAPVVVFALVCLGTLAVTRYPIVTLKAVGRDLGYVFGGYYLATRVVTSRRRLVLLLVGVVFAGVLLALYGLFTQLKEGVRVYQDVAMPFFRNHCIYAGYLSFIFALALAFVLGHLRYERRGVGSLVLGVLGIAIFLSFVRGAWLSLLGTLMFYAWILREKVDYKVFTVVFLLMVMTCVVITGLELWGTLIERVQTIIDTGYVANFDRLDRWMSAWEMFKDHKILGIGYGTYGDRYQDEYVYYKKAFWSGTRMGAHNLYLELMAETGIVGLLAFLWLIWRFFLEALRQIRGESSAFRRTVLIGAVGAMITFLLHAFVNNLGPSDKIYTFFWLLIALVPIMSRLRTLEETKGEAAVQVS